ncbi:MAG: transcription antitermination factor NusB [Nitrospiraceae bacterium]
MGSRRQSRVCALQILFQWDVHGTVGDWLDDFWVQHPVEGEVRQFAEQLAEGVVSHHKDVDGLISAHATNWTVGRMPIVDRNIIRLGLYELLWIPEVPAKVSVNEAIELAKRFADDETKRFVNGILDQVLKEDPRLEAKRREMIPVDPRGVGHETEGDL